MSPMGKFKFLSKEKISQLPKNSGVYCFRNGKRKILYIGKATNIKERVKNHFQQQSFKDNLFIDRVKKTGYLKTESEIEALILEANLIKKCRPKYNIVWRDDKNYFYVGATKEEYPLIFITHQIKRNAEYIGPFVDGKSLKETLKVLRKVFPYRSCSPPAGRLPKHPCLWYHLQRCLAPCLLKSDLTEQIPNLKVEVKKFSQKNRKNIMEILQGKKNKVLKKLKKEMKELSKGQYFEKAAKIRNQIKYLEKVLANSKIFEPATVDYKGNWNLTQNILKRILKIKKDISRIEAYDISNIQGQEAAGSAITFINGLPNKNFYRKFKVKITCKPNDVAMIKEILGRRLAHPEWLYPDLILIDGGRAQLNAALKIKNEQVPRKREQKSKIKSKIKVISLAKKRNELFIEGKKKPILLKNLPREIFNLILQLRDEAHRFARKYHLKLRKIDLGLNK